MEINYKQLTFAREYRGYSQTELASQIRGLSQSNLSRFEKGIGYLSDDVISRVVSFLNFPEFFFEKNIANRPENAHYRKRAGVNKKEKSIIEHSIRLIGYIIDQMSTFLEFPEFAVKTIDIEEGFSPEYIAQYTRRYLGMKDEPVRDIHSLLERNGIIIVEMDADRELFDGVSFLTDTGFPVMVINRDFTNDRKRFTIAHELGHMIIHTNESFLFPDHRNKEDEANRFASEFLMPKEAIENSLRNLKLSYLTELKRYWLTSMASIIRRSKDLNCISDDKYRQFNIELSRKGFKRREPLDVYIDKPNLFSAACELLRKELEYSDAELSEAFSLPVDVLNRFCNPSANQFNLRIHRAMDAH
jgi:Zn-dependent peptidase ImmA (M78 family)